MKHYLILLSLLMLSSCASLQYAGTASYSVKPIVDAKGNVICCSVDVKNGKEISNLEAHIQKDGDKYTVDLKEQGVAAFAGQAIAAGATKEAIDAAVKSALTIALAPILPALAPALAAPGLGAAAIGAGSIIGIQKALAK